MCALTSSSFYEHIGQPPPSEEELVEILRKAVDSSREKRYHGDKGIEVLSPEGMCESVYYTLVVIKYTHSHTFRV